MRREEAARMADWVRSLSLPPGAICLNIGSSTEDFRTRSHPHIDRLFFAPLRQSGLRVLHCDMKADPGVDLVGDVLDPAYQQRLRATGAQLLICNNLLEHLVDPQPFVSACASLVTPGGYALFTVPFSFPYHPDPIDTLFRPSPRQLAEMFPAWEVIKSEKMACGSFREDLKKGRGLFPNSVHYLARMAVPFYKPRYWISSIHRLWWLFRDYKITMLLIRKPERPEVVPARAPELQPSL
jgi:SAM-dependent methyltransferase